MPKRGWGRLALAAVAGVAAAAGCKDSNEPEPEPIAGSFALSAISGRLPFVVAAGLGGDTRIVSGRLTVISRDSIRDVLHFRTFSASGQVGPLDADSGVSAYRRAGDTLFISRQPPYSTSSYTDTAVRAYDNFLLVTRRLAKINGFRPADRYQTVYARQ